MATRKRKAKRDVEKDYPAKQFVAKLRRLADCIEGGKRMRIQIAGERISIPPDALISIEHERGDGEEEVELRGDGVVAFDGDRTWATDPSTSVRAVVRRDGPRVDGPRRGPDPRPAPRGLQAR